MWVMVLPPSNRSQTVGQISLYLFPSCWRLTMSMVCFFFSTIVVAVCYYVVTGNAMSRTKCFWKSCEWEHYTVCIYVVKTSAFGLSEWNCNQRRYVLKRFDDAGRFDDSLFLRKVSHFRVSSSVPIRHVREYNKTQNYNTATHKQRRCGTVPIYKQFIHSFIHYDVSERY